MKRASKVFIKLMQYIGGIGFIACMLYIVLNILTRTFINIAIPGVYEMTGLFAVVFASSAILVSMAEEGQTVVDLFVDKLTGKSKIIQRIISHIVDLVYYGILAFAAWNLGFSKLMNHEVTSTIHFPVAPFRLYWCACAAIIVIIEIIKIVEDIKSSKSTSENEII